LYRRPRTQIIKEVRIMKKNIGDIERLIRLVAGLAIVLLFFVGPKTPWALLGIVPARRANTAPKKGAVATIPDSP
jgi:hypothetical protein